MYSALLVCVNVTAGTAKQSEAMLNCGLVEKLRELLETSHDQKILKMACFTIANIAAGTPSQIEILTRTDIYQLLEKTFLVSSRPTQTEILHVVNNTIYNAGSLGNQLQYLDSILQHGLKIDHPPMLRITLAALLIAEYSGLIQILPSEG